jgi:CheY-like chemotaxis protein
VRHSITANTSVVRWGNDGVGLKFVMENHKGLREGQSPQIAGVDERELNGFLQLARSVKRDGEAKDTAFQIGIAQGDVIHDIEQQLLPFSTDLQPAENGKDTNSSPIGVPSNQASTNISGQALNGIEPHPMDRIEAPRPCNPPYPVARISTPLMVSPLKHEQAISGYANPNVDNHFIRPIDSSLLIGSLKDLPRRPVKVADASLPLMNVSNTSQLPLPGVPSSTPSRRRPRVLLIDDEYVEIAFLAGTLEDDYEIIFATDGVSALETAGRDMPDLILLDVNMPGIDGFEVCRRLKAENRTKEIPVIFITGLNEATAETKALKMGAVDYITKPFHPAPLKVRVDMHIRPQTQWAN